MRLHGGQAQRVFLYWGRPIAPLVALAAYGVFAIFTSWREVAPIMLVLALSVLAALLYIAAARVVAKENVLRTMLFVDTMLLAGMTVALERPDVLAIAYFWSIGLAAFFFGARITAATTALAAACAAVVPYLGDFGADAVIVVTDVLVLCLIGGLLALLAHHARRAENFLALERSQAEAALRIADRIRSSLELDEVLRVAVEELGKATRAARAVLAVFAPDHAPLYEWTAPGVNAIGESERTAGPLDWFAKMPEPSIIVSRADVHDPGRAYMDAHGIGSMLGYPIVWQDRVIAVIAFHARRPRRWRETIPLLDRVVPQLASALAQADVYAQQRATVERLEELTRMREDLVANVSHELRTPLTSTIGFLQTLERGDIELTPEQRREFLSIARREAERLARLVDDLLQLTRWDRGAISLIREPVDVPQLVQRAAEAVAVPPDRRIRIEVPNGLTARVDADRMLQVLTNLLSNGVRHGDGDVVVEAREDREHVELAISDGGHGVAPDNVPALFEPFARWSKHRDSSGLGLAIARKIVEAHGGTLTYRGPANGTRHAFVVELPKLEQTT